MGIDLPSEDYEILEEHGKWNGYKVWYVTQKAGVGCTLGLPQFLLSDGNSYRYAKQPGETMEIMDWFYSKDLDEE